jgi:hypothetical protein
MLACDSAYLQTDMLARCEGVRCVMHRLLYRMAVGLTDRVRVCTSSSNI